MADIPTINDTRDTLLLLAHGATMHWRLLNDWWLQEGGVRTPMTSGCATAVIACKWVDWDADAFRYRINEYGMQTYQARRKATR